MSDTKDNTNVSEVDINLEDILNTGASVMTPADSEKKKSVFSPMSVDTSFLDKDFQKGGPVEQNETPAAETSEETSEETPAAETQEEAPSAETTEQILAPPSDETIEADADKDKGGRPTKTVAVLKSLQEKGLIQPFEGEEDFSKYSEKDLVELFEMNLENQREKLMGDLPAQFFQNMPQEMQQAYHYIANGGQDVKGMFRSLAASQEMRDLDVSSEPGQVYAIRSYLQATNYGTPEEIEDEIYSLKDRGELEKKAKQFKPKLDAMQQEIVNQRLAQQEDATRKRHQQAAVYQDNVYKVLEKGVLNGTKLDNRVQNLLYSGLVQPNYPSVSGSQTNLLGHLLEKYQFHEPNHELIAEALWLLADPDGYRTELRGQGSSEAAQETARKLKSAQADMSNSTASEEPEDTGRPARKTGVQRPKRNFFGR